MIGFFYIFKTAEYFLIYFLVVNYVRDEKQIRQFLFFALLTACLLGLYTLPQIPHQTEIFSTHRITAPFEGTPEPGTVGGYMAFLLLITISLFLYERRPKVKWAYALLTVLIFLPFVMTLNRTSYAAFIGGVVVMALLSRNKVLLFLLVGFLACSPLWAPQSVKERIAFTWEDAKNPGRTMGVDFSLQERVMVYRRMWGGVKKNPLIGLGVTSWQTSDSQWARTFHEIGAIGLGLWIWIFLRLFRISRWLFNHIDQGVTKGLALGYAAAMIGLIIHGFGNITFYVVRIMEPFWFITGLVVSLYNVRCGYTDN